MNICLFTSEEISKPLSAFDERAIHLNKVLHKKSGDTFLAGIIGASSGLATITKTLEVANPKSGKIGLQYEFAFEPKSDGKTLFPLKMIIGFPRPIQLRRLLRDVAGLGVCEVHLTGTELGEKSYMQSTLVEKGSAEKMLLDGTIQAGSTHVPKLFLHSSLKECIEFLQNQDENTSNEKCSIENSSFEKKIALDNVRPKESLKVFIDNLLKKTTSFDKDVSLKNISVVAAIGSERGWTDNERDLLCQKGFTLCSMGKRILRTETAATVSASIILSGLGFLD